MVDQILSSLHLKQGREKALERRHPWVFSGAVNKIEGNPQCGDLITVYSSDNILLGIGAYSHKSQITCRIWQFYPKENNIDIKQVIKKRIENTINLRKRLNISASSNAYRLIHGESDLLPGLIVDIYHDTAIIQLLSCGVEIQRDLIAEFLLSLPNIKSVYERSDAEVRSLEGLPLRTGYLMGKKYVNSTVKINENGILYNCSLADGQKTGFYLDQRDNRLRLRGMSKDLDVLDCFCYTGGFALNAYLGGAKHVTAVDISNESLKTFHENLLLNNMDVDKFELISNDVFKQLRTFRDEARQFDLIILDPPKFAPTRKQVKRASRGYKDINLLALKLLRPGGILFTFSCSGGVDSALFQKIVAGAAEDAGANVQILYRLTQAPDHPVLLSFPEGEYLKGLVCIKK